MDYRGFAALRIKRLKKPRVVVECFTHAEISKLLAAADVLKGYLPNGVRKGDMVRALIMVAYCTGLRRGDIYRLKRSQFANGTASVIQHKTGYTVRVALSAECQVALAKLKPDTADDRLIPWPYHPDALQKSFQKCVKMAGVRDGQFRWLRRSAGSYAESITPGAGSRLLGHADGRVFAKHYEDQSITRAVAISPPPIAPPELALA